MGEVYLALDATVLQPLAVKVLRPELAGDPARRKHFLQEARIAARLRHVHIAEIIDYASSGPTAYIAMEFIAGETLEQIVQRRGPLPVSEACATFARRPPGWPTPRGRASSTATSSRRT